LLFLVVVLTYFSLTCMFQIQDCNGEPINIIPKSERGCPRNGFLIGELLLSPSAAITTGYIKYYRGDHCFIPWCFHWDNRNSKTMASNSNTFSGQTWDAINLCIGACQSIAIKSVHNSNVARGNDQLVCLHQPYPSFGRQDKFHLMVNPCITAVTTHTHTTDWGGS
jgi:hypothetical protein